MGARSEWRSSAASYCSGKTMKTGWSEREFSTCTRNGLLLEYAGRDADAMLQASPLFGGLRGRAAITALPSALRAHDAVDHVVGDPVDDELFGRIAAGSEGARAHAALHDGIDLQIFAHDLTVLIIIGRADDFAEIGARNRRLGESPVLIEPELAGALREILAKLHV